MRHAAAFAGSPLELYDIHPAESAVTARQDAYIRSRDFDRPTVVFDLDVMRAKYRALEAGLGDATIHYAVKANPAPEVVAAVAALGGHFDAASRGEIDLCLSLGVAPSRIAFGNTIKRASRHRPCPRDGRRAVRGRRRGGALQDRRARARRAGDHPHAGRGERGRLAAQPQVRLLAARGAAADGPRPLPRARRRRHLVPRRQPDARARDVGDWRSTPRTRSGPRRPRRGHGLRILNIGGGFPAFYGQPLPATEDYAAEVMRMVRHRFGAEVAGDGRARPRPGGRGGRDRRRGAAGRAQGPGRPGALGLSRHRQVLRARRDHRRGDPLPVRDAARRRRHRRLHPRRPVLQLGRRALREAPGPAAARARSRATRCGSSAPAPTRRATRRSASTASRRSRRCSSADRPSGPIARRKVADAHRPGHRSAPDRGRSRSRRLRRRRRRSPRCWRGSAALDPAARLGDADRRSGRERHAGRSTRRLRAMLAGLPAAAGGDPGQPRPARRLRRRARRQRHRDRRRAVPAARRRGRARCG